MTDGGNVLAFPEAPAAIELRHLRAFVAVAEELHFGRAADRLHLSQPALSRQVSALERLVGCALLRRSSHHVELTLAGEALLDRARPLLGEIEAAISATQAVGGETMARIAALWAPVMDIARVSGEISGARAAYESLHANFAPPPEVSVTPANAGGVPALVVSAAAEQPPRLLYLHGGGHVLGSAYGYRHLAGALASAAGAAALVPEYRLAPEHPYPASVDDALAAYRWMLEAGVPADEIVVCGDSSGGGLATALLLRATREGLPRPGGAILFCPMVDLLLELEPQAPQDDRDAIAPFVEMYLAGHDPRDPEMNPLYADLSGFPPLLVQGATGDPRLADARALVQRTRAHGVWAKLDVYPAETHVFQIFWSFLAEAADALAAAGEFTRAIRAEARAAHG